MVRKETWSDCHKRIPVFQPQPKHGTHQIEYGIKEGDTCLCYFLCTFMGHDISEPGFAQPNGSRKSSNTGPDDHNLEVRDPSFQGVLQVNIFSGAVRGYKHIAHS